MRMRSPRIAPAVGVLAVLVLLLSASAGVGAVPPSQVQRVQVVNGAGPLPGQSVPVAIQGTPTVSISGTPREVYRHRFLLTITPDNDTAYEEINPVDATRILVIEDISAGATMPTGQHVRVQLNVSSNAANLTYHSLVMTAQPGVTTNPPDLYVASRTSRIYVPPGLSLVAAAVRDSLDSTAYIDVDISGYLVSPGGSLAP